MTARFEYSALMKRKLRAESWSEQGVSSLHEAREAIAQLPLAAAIEMVDYYVWEGQFIYRSYFPWLALYIADTARDFGEEEVWRNLNKIADHFATTGFPPLAIEVVAQHGRTPNALIQLQEQDAAPVLIYKPTGETLGASMWEAQSLRTLEELKTALSDGRRDAARSLLDRYHAELKPVHDGLTEWAWLWMTLVADRHGEAAMFDQLRRAGELLRGAGLRMQASIPIKELVLQMAMAMRGHRCGPGEEGDIDIVEDHEKYMITFDACGSGGRMRRKGELDGLPARQDPPFNFGVTKEASPNSWGRKGVPYYCTHCAVWSELMSTDLIGYPGRITLFNPDGSKPCAWAIYKRPEDIPEEYFTRIGRKRDPSRFNKLPDQK